jgi:hypothetical protein
LLNVFHNIKQAIASVHNLLYNIGFSRNPSPADADNDDGVAQCDTDITTVADRAKRLKSQLTAATKAYEKARRFNESLADEDDVLAVSQERMEEMKKQIVSACCHLFMWHIY